MKKLYNNKNFWLFIIMAIGLLLRLYKINSPILDLYPTRQEQCAMIARNFFRHSYNIFHAEVDWFGPFDSSWRLEFPLISYIAALLYSIFGIHEFLGRIVSITFSLGSIYLVFQLTKKLFNQKTAIYASFLFTVSPLGVYFGRAFMPDMAMIFFSIASLYYFYQWLELDYKFNYILAFIATSMAFLIKIPSLYLCLPLFYLAYSKYRNKIFLKPSIFIFFFFTIFLSILWHIKANANLVTVLITDRSNLIMLMQPDFYRRIMESISIFVLTPVGAFLALLGFVLSVNKREGYLLHFWLLAIIIYTLLAAEANYIHYYYQLPLVPIFSIFAAKAIDRFTHPEIWKHSIFFKLNTNLTICVMMVTILITGFLAIRPCFKWNITTYRAFRAVNALTEKDAVIIAGRCKQQAPLYYTDRKGWETNENPPGSLSYSWSSTLNKYHFPKKDNESLIMADEVELVKFLIKQGADYYFTTNIDVFKQEPHFRDYMYNNFKVLREEKGFVIFDLKRK